MKRIFTVLLVLILMFSFAPSVMAAPDGGVLAENGGYEESFYRDQPKTWTFTPSQTGEYLLFTPGSGSLIGQIVGQTPIDSYDVQSGQRVQVYSLTGGTAYQVRIEMNPAEPGDRVVDVFNIDRKKPLERLTINADSMTVKRDDYNSLYVEAAPYYYPLTGLKWTSSDNSVIEIDSAQGNECGFWARKVGTAKITATLGGKSVSCTITVEKSTGYWDDYEVWPATQTQKKLTLPANQGTAFSYIPTHTGTYALHSEGEVHAYIRGTSPSHILNERRVDTIEGDYQLVDLIAGESYVLEVASNFVDGPSATGTAYIEKAREISDIILFGSNMTDVSGITGYVGGMKELYAMSDPIYAFGLHGGFQYSSSNSTIADPNDEEGASQHINLYKAGSCNITVSCGGISVSCPVTVKPSPVLKAGTITKLTFGALDAYGVTCLFTPEKSANYTFTVKGTGGTCHIEGTNIGAPIYGSGSMSGWLQAGKTYQVILGVGGSDHTVSVSGGGAVAPTEPATPGPSTIPTDPNQPADPNATTGPSRPTTAPDPALQELADEMGGSFDGENIRVFATQEHIELSAAHLSQLAQSNAGLMISGGRFDVKLDSKVLEAVVKAGGENVTLQVRSLTEHSLAPAQKEALKGKNAAIVIDVELTAGDSYIHDFAGGSATVTVPFVPEKGMQYTVFYLAEDGKLEQVASSCTDATLTFTTGHFSQYVVLAEKDASVGTVGGAEGPGAVIVKMLPWLLIGGAVIAGAVAAVIVLKKKKS